MIRSKVRKHVHALKNVMLTVAIIHMVILVGYSIVSLKGSLLNFFSITEIDMLFPGLLTTEYSFAYSSLVVVFLYILFYFFA